MLIEVDAIVNMGITIRKWGHLLRLCSKWEVKMGLKVGLVCFDVEIPICRQKGKQLIFKDLKLIVECWNLLKPVSNPRRSYETILNKA